MIVEVRNLHRRFGQLDAVKQLSFHMNAGEIFGFIGPNGAGKTTTMRILATLDMPTSGDAFIGGHSVTQYPDRVRPLFGLMPDFQGVYPNMDVADYLDFFARAYRLRGARRRSAIASVIDFAELGPLLTKQVTTLSKGMRQRLALARTLIHDPDILILDEPTAGLDPRARVEFRELVKMLASNGKAVLISSHILSDLSDMCDRVAILEQGRLVATGTIKEVQAMARQRRTERAGGDSITAGVETHPVVLTVIDGGEPLEKFLTLQPGVEDVRVTDGQAELLFTGGDEGLSQLLARIIAERFAVTHFRRIDDNLEDVFMTLTDGKVQ